jgi:hypothetical protein
MGKLEAFSFIIKSGNKLTIDVKYEVNEMRKMKLLQLFLLYQALCEVY